MRFLAVLVLLALFFGMSVNSAQARLTELMVELSETHVDITTGFDGAKLVMFGTRKNEKGNIAIVVRGPHKDMTVRKKSSVLGAWMNTTFITFQNVPGFYDFAVTPGMMKKVDLDFLKETGIGVRSLVFNAAEADDHIGTDLKDFQSALVRNKQTEGLFASQPKEIKILNDHFFRTEFYLPANVPKGEYVIETFVILGDRIVERHETSIKVEQIGMSSAIYEFSKTHGLAYGLICVFIAVFAGWSINVIRQTA